MEYADKEMICEKCKEKYIFPCGEQKFFEEKGFIPPKKCPKCRGKENVKRPDSNSFLVKCSDCSKEFHITFNPKGKKIACYDCYLKKNNS